jgi:hypothetical protein
MRAQWKVEATAVLTALVVAACASPSTTSGHEYEQFRFSCCAGTDLQTAWHPGDHVALHWVVESSGTTTNPTPSPITLTADLSGPFESVAALKAAGTEPETLTATPLHVSDLNPGNPVSTIVLPADLADGWYNLVSSVNGLGTALAVRLLSG